MDGAQYQSSRREPRNLKLRLGLDPDAAIGSVRDLRKALYDFFMPKSLVTFRFHLIEGPGILDFLDLDIQARVEEFVSPLFAQEPTVDLSLMCFDPDFRDVVPVNVSYWSTAGLDEQQINYRGTVDTGIEFVFRADRNVSGVTVYHRPPDGTLRVMEFTGALQAGDILRINTVRGAKSVVRTRAGVDTPVLYNLSPVSNWLELQPGLNNYRVYAQGVRVPYEINYTTRYGGL